MHTHFLESRSPRHYTCPETSRRIYTNITTFTTTASSSDKSKYPLQRIKQISVILPPLPAKGKVTALHVCFASFAFYGGLVLVQVAQLSTFVTSSSVIAQQLRFGVNFEKSS